MAVGKESLRIEIRDLKLDHVSKHCDTLMISLDEDEETGFAGIRIDLEDSGASGMGLSIGQTRIRGESFWITSESFEKIFNVFKEFVIPAMIEESKNPADGVEYVVFRKEAT